MALITADIAQNNGALTSRKERALDPYPNSTIYVWRVSFTSSPDADEIEELSSFATGYYFLDKHVAHSVLTKEEREEATVWHGAYVFAGDKRP